jgi:mannosyl-3-phosphoglycerate phosphatase
MLIIFTDLDGTLLDRESYSFQPALDALLAVRSSNIPLVLSTSKTQSELRVIRDSIGCGDLWIAENGAIVSIPAGYFPFSISRLKREDGRDVFRLGCPYEETVAALRQASLESGVPVCAFSDLEPAQIAEIAGMPLADAARAKEREHDEPFLVTDEQRAGPLLHKIGELGKTWTRGGRFYHISDAIDKGKAARFLCDQFRRIDPGLRTLGLGDALNDVALLQACDMQVILRSPFVAEMQRLLPDASVTKEPGPAGWNQAVLAMLHG